MATVGRGSTLVRAIVIAGGLVMATGTLTGVAAAQGSPTLTLEQAIDEALVRNDRLVNQRDVAEQAALSLRLARSGFRPRITPQVYGSLLRSDFSSQTYRVDVSQKLETGTELRLRMGTQSSLIPSDPQGLGNDVLFYNADTTVSVSQPLLRGFGRSVARRAITWAELQGADAARQQRLLEQQVAVEVATAYYTIVAQRAMVDAATQSLARARTLAEASAAKLQAGLVSQLDVLRAQQLVAQADLQVLDARAAVDDARERLALLMGRSDATGIDVTPIIPPPAAEPVDQDAATAIALANRADLQMRRAASADAGERVRFARNQLLPQVDVNMSLTRQTTSPTLAGSFGLDGYRFVTFFAIGMPVDRTADQVEHALARLDEERRIREVALLERQIADDVRRAIRERERLARVVTSTETSVELSRKELEVAQLRFRTGLSNNLDVITAEGGLLLAESRRIQALADAAVGQLRLQALLGVLDNRADGRAGVTPVATGLARCAAPLCGGR
ncbi:transporter [Luteitalea sp. TBR-22]|uniref:TolC family protein n=1 Tax=Luteitalea sp. TBR-22 TaxID=2802971 RepID=UPI001AFA10C4|nr:TolC family protein [Luteitalea sp. TBR-22]BCS31801.1 transporter [Luteitalea sp. TBR-22]